MRPHDGREHLFRDDAGAAVERAARLEAENARLRAALARSSTPTPPGGYPRQSQIATVRTRRRVPALAVGLVVGLGIVVGVLFGLVIAARPLVRDARAHPPGSSGGTPGAQRLEPVPMPVVEPAPSSR